MRDVAAIAVVDIRPDIPGALTALSRDVLREAGAFARRNGGELVVVAVAPPLGRDLFWSDAQPLRMLRQYRDRLRRARAALQRHLEELCAGIPVMVRVQFGPVSDLVARHARETRAKVVVIGEQPQNPLVRWLSGRSLREIVRRTPCPVLVVRSRGAERPHVERKAA